MKPTITKREKQYLDQLEAGLDTNKKLADHFDVVTSSAYAVMRSLMTKDVVSGEKRNVGRRQKEEFQYTPTGKAYNISTAAMRCGKFAKRKAAPIAIEKQQHAPFEFFIFPWIDAPEMEA